MLIKTRKINVISDSTKNSTNLPKLITKPYLGLNSMHQWAIPRIQIKTQTKVLVPKIASCYFYLFSLYFLFVWNRKERFEYFLKKNNENRENCNQLAISKSLISCNRGLMCIFLEPRHRTSLYCDVIKMVNINIIGFLDNE